MTVSVIVPIEMSYDGIVHEYTDDANPDTGLDGGGHVFRLLPLFMDAVSIANYTYQQANTVAQSPYTSASFTSTADITLEQGDLSFTIQIGKSFSIGQGVNIAEPSGLNIMVGSIKTYDLATGAMTVRVNTVVGSGTFPTGTVFTVSLGALLPGSISFPVGAATIGYLNVPQNTQAGDYTLALSDQGKHVYHPTSDTTARTYTIPTNATVAFPIGTVITIVNDTSAGLITLTTADTLVLAGTGTTGDRTISANGIVTILKISATRWLASGSGLL